MTPDLFRHTTLVCTLACTLALAGTAPLPALAQPAPAAPAASAALPAVPPLERAPGDLSQTRRFVLPNGLKVLLVHDPKFNVSSAALVAGVGSLADPPQRQGLAHFLEHMLFLGTDKYPDITGWQAHLQRNAGVHNAYTAADRTNYFFEIRHDAYADALDRFAQFFVAPLFDARFTEREVNAVNSEHQKNLENDLWRENQLSTMAYAAGHPMRHFGTGSRATLGSVTRDELLTFYRSHYSANRMALVLASPASLDQLERWARQSFAAVPDRQLPELRYPAGYLPRKAALRMLQMEPIKDLRTLNLEFPLPSLRDGWPHKSAELLGYVFGAEGPGSLLAQLKADGLATSLSAGAQSTSRDLASLELHVGLTPQGQAAVPRVLQLVFAQARQLREQGLPPHVFGERAALARLDERFRDKGEGANFASALANLVLDHPLELAERVPYLWLKEDPAALRSLLDPITPDNLLVTLVAKGVATDRTEPVYGTRYRYTEDTGPAYAALLQPPRVATLQPPRPNPFVPARTSQQPLQPTRLIDEPGLSLYHAQDTEFQRPQAAYVLRHVLPRSLAGARSAALLSFYQACANEALNETTYTAAEAGLRFVLAASLDGVTLATEGWDESNARLLDAVVPGLVDIQLSPARFAALKDRLLRGLSAAAQADAWMQVRESRRALVREFYATPAEQLAAARDITLEQVQAFARQLYASGKLEALAYGNLGPTEAVAAVRRVAARLQTQGRPEGELLRNRLLVDRPGQALRLVDPLQVNNSVLRRELVLGGNDAELRAATQVLASFIGDSFYSELRTRQQLGYIVQATAFEDERQSVALFLVQSGDYPPDEIARRTDAFIATYPKQLADLPEDVWAAIVAGVRSRLLERDKAVVDRAQRLFALGYDKQADWGRTEATVAALDRLTRTRVAQILATALDPATRRQRDFIGQARQHAAPAQGSSTGPDRAAWKQGQRYD